MPDQRPAQAASTAKFETTHWSVVLAAKEIGTPDAGVALENLCRTYWSPLYAYLRRQGSTPADAQDLVQGFLADLLEREAFAVVDRERGKFRSFLLASLKHFAANDRARLRTQKRGGGKFFVPLDEVEEQFLAAGDLSPDEAYARVWALSVVRHTIGLLSREHEGPRQAAVFAALEPFLSGDRAAPPYASVAASLGLGESGVKMAVQRLRRRFGELLRREIARTVGGSAEVDEEIRALFGTLCS